MKRALAPATNPTGLGSAVAAIYAAVVMILNAVNHHGAINAQVVIAAIAAAAFLYTRMKVTPVADPKDGNGQPLVAALPGPPPAVPAGLPGIATLGIPATAMPPVPPEKTLIQPPAPPAAPE